MREGKRKKAKGKSKSEIDNPRLLPLPSAFSFPKGLPEGPLSAINAHVEATRVVPVVIVVHAQEQPAALRHGDRRARGSDCERRSIADPANQATHRHLTNRICRTRRKVLVSIGASRHPASEFHRP